ARDQAPMTPSELLGQLADPSLAVCAAQVLPRPIDAGRGRYRIDEPASEQPLHEVESFFPGASVVKLLVELTSLWQDVGERDRVVRQLVHRDAEKAMGTERREPQLDASPRCGSAHQGRSGMDSRDERRVFVDAPARLLDLPR